MTFGTLDVGTTYKVTKHAVLDGVVQAGNIGEDTISSGETYAVPARINRTDYHFGGWYTTAACSTAYTAKTITANTDIYAKYTTLSKDSYI